MSREKFERLVEQFGPPLTRLTSAYASAADREDLLQEILLAIWNALPRFRGDCSERTWIYRIAHNISISYSLRHPRRREESLEEHHRTQVSVESDYADAERRASLMRAVQSLQASDKQVVLLYLEGLRNVEISEIVGLTEGAIATRLTRLRARLSELVGGSGSHHEQPR